MKNRFVDFTKLLVIAAISIAAYELVKPYFITPVVNGNNICMNYSEGSISKLSSSLVRDMVNKYENGQLARIRYNYFQGFGNSEMNDAKSIWFDLETLKQFLYHIENITKTKDSSITSDKLGVRIYYAAYPERTEWLNEYYKGDLLEMKNDTVTKDYGKKHTLVMIPTIRRIVKDSVGNFDFNPLYDKSSYTIGLRSAIVENELNNSIMALPSFKYTGPTPVTGSTAARNHGGLIPPRTPIKDELAF